MTKIKPDDAKSSFVDQIIEYEQGDMDEETTVEFFQDLVNSGMAWKLQGHYGRTAAALIDAGLIQPKVKAV